MFNLCLINVVIILLLSITSVYCVGLRTTFMYTRVSVEMVTDKHVSLNANVINLGSHNNHSY